MDGIYIFLLCDLDDLINIQICVDGVLIGIQLIRLIRFHAEQRIFILLGIDSNGGNSQFIQCTENTDRDLSTVRYHYFPEFANICSFHNSHSSFSHCLFILSHFFYEY